MQPHTAASILIAVLVLSTVITMEITGDIGVRVVDETLPSPESFNIELIVERERGEKIVKLGGLRIPCGNMQVKSYVIDYEGNLTIVIGGELTLESERFRYRIPMPCLASIGELCYRILMLIPGYDTPLKVEEGIYNITLILSWSAKGSGRLRLRMVPQLSGSC